MFNGLEVTFAWDIGTWSCHKSAGVAVWLFHGAGTTEREIWRHQHLRSKVLKFRRTILHEKKILLSVCKAVKTKYICNSNINGNIWVLIISYVGKSVLYRHQWDSQFGPINFVFSLKYYINVCYVVLRNLSHKFYNISDGVSLTTIVAQHNGEETYQLTTYIH